MTDVDERAYRELAIEWNLDADDPRVREMLPKTAAYAAKRLTIATRDLLHEVELSAVGRAVYRLMRKLNRWVTG